MKHRKTVTLACALALSSAPFAAMAYTAESALNACAAAVTRDLSTSELTWRLDEDSETGGHLRGLEMIHLDVRDAASDKVVARADCVVDARARVKRVKTLPLDAADAKERSLTAY